MPQIVANAPRANQRFSARSIALHRHCDALPASDAQRSQPTPGATPSHFVKESNQHPATRSADWVSESNGSAIDIDFVAIPPELAPDGQRLSSKSLVGFNQVDRVESPLCLLQTLSHRRDRATSHVGGIDTGTGECGDTRQW